MAVGNVTSAAPVASTQASLGTPGGQPKAGGSPNAKVATGYDPAPVTGGGAAAPSMAQAAGGGALGDFASDGVAKIAAFAQNGMNQIQQMIQGDMAANNGQVDPAKMQQYTMQMSTFEMIMQMAKKIQDSKEAASRAWLN